MKIEGVPSGFEIRSVYDAQGLADACMSGQKLQEGERVVCAIIRPSDPVCTWQFGVFADGWITQEEDGEIEWHSQEPHVIKSGEWWTSNGIGGSVYGLANPPVFREDLHWKDRVVQVGPSVEK